MSIRTTACIVTALGLGLLMGAAADHSFIKNVSTVPWTELKVPGLPDGLHGRSLHDNPRTKMGTTIIKYPKGFREPKHYHLTSGHYIYVLKGKLHSPQGD